MCSTRFGRFGRDATEDAGMRFRAVGRKLRFEYSVWWLEFVGEMVGVDAV